MARKRRNPRKIPVRKNFAFLIPLAPWLIAGVAGLGGLALAAKYAAAKTGEAASAASPKLIGPAIGGSSAYLIARSKKMDTPYTIAATTLGLTVGLIGGNIYQKIAKKAKEKEEAAKEAAYQEQWHIYDPTTWGRDWK